MIERLQKQNFYGKNIDFIHFSSAGDFGACGNLAIPLARAEAFPAKGGRLDIYNSTKFNLLLFSHKKNINYENAINKDFCYECFLSLSGKRSERPFRKAKAQFES